MNKEHNSEQNNNEEKIRIFPSVLEDPNKIDSQIKTILSGHEKRLFALEVHLEHTGSKEAIEALKAEIHRESNNQTWRIVGAVTAISTALLSIAVAIIIAVVQHFEASDSPSPTSVLPSAPLPPQIIVIPEQNPKQPQQAQ